MGTAQKCNNGVVCGLTPDSFLGASSQRYFGSSFKEVNHFIDEMKIEDGNLFANFFIQWPISWSEKKGISLRPHIGTLDFFLIASVLAETYLRVVKKIHGNRISEMWISEFHCKAGSKCIEKNTNYCKCQLTSEISKANQTEFILGISIVDTTVVLKILSPNKREEILSDLGQQIDYKHESYYSDCYKRPSRDIKNIEIYPQKKYITADFELKHANDSSYKGLGSIYMPCITFCDLILVCGQLSQILLYQLDNTTRENASNLWLRNIHCIYRTPINARTNVSVEVKKTKMINLRGLRYNCSDFVFNFNSGDLIAECSSAYQPFAE